MNIALILLATLAVLGCSSEPTPTGPTAPPHPSEPAPPAPPAPIASDALLMGMVVGESGACIEGGKVEVVSGQRVGESIVQKTPCDAWGDDGGFEFTNLTPAVEMVLRASAPGYVTVDASVVPTSGWPQQYFVVTLTRIPPGN